jgi:iron complex outermembrane receptor protein
MCTTLRRSASAAPFRSLNRWFATLLAIALATLTPFAAAQEATGTIRGKVQNASNGAYLKNVNVAVTGTNLATTTDEFGNFELTRVPAGERTVKATYVGEAELTATVQVSAGAAVNQDFTFRKTSSTELDKEGRVVLDPFRVSTERYRNADAIAIAEERTSVNIKNVVSVEAFGNVPNGNVGEFVKFLPGVQVDYGAFNSNGQGYAESDATGISIRGFGPEDTAILINGMPVASASPGNLSRQVAIDQLTINNASRIEITKVPTPDMPANSMGGQVNLITKSAFEQAKPSYTAGAWFNLNSMQAGNAFKKTAGPVNDRTYKTQPNIKAGIVYPFTKNFGLAFDASLTNEINQTYQSSPTWTFTGAFSNLAGKPIGLDNPALTRSQVTDISRLSKRKSANLAADWKPSPSQIIRANVQYSTYDGSEAQRRLDFRPTVAAGADWGPNYTIGTTGNNTLAQTVTTFDRVGDTKSAQATYSLKKDGWTVSAAASISKSKSEFVTAPHGHYSEVDYTLNPGQVTLVNVNSESAAPNKVTSVWRTGTALAGQDKVYTSLANWSQDGTTAREAQALNQSRVTLMNLDVERDLSFLPFIGSNTLSIKVGGRREEEKVDKTGLGTGFAYTLKPGANYLNSEVLDTNYAGLSPGFDLAPQEWASSYKLYELNQKNSIFELPADNTSGGANNYGSYANQQKHMTDTKDSYYAMMSGKFFRNRLSVVGGARWQTSTRDGLGPVIDGTWNYAKTADGKIYRDTFYKGGVKFDGTANTRSNADGTTTNVTDFRTDSALISRLTAANVKFPDHLYTATSASVESAMLRLKALAPIHGKVTGDPALSLNFAYNLTKKIDLKLAVSRTFKQPKLEDAVAGLLSGNGAFSITENATIPADGTLGNISVANPNLLPEQSLNYDFEASYYNDKGGRFSVSYWRKAVTNQIESLSVYSSDPGFGVIVDALGLDPNGYNNYLLKSSYNSVGTQHTEGWELQVNQDMSYFGNWGKHFSFFLSYAFNTLGEPTAAIPVTLTSPGGTPVVITPTIATITQRANRFGGAGLQYSGRRLTLQVRGTYRNDNEISGRVTLTGVDAGNFLRKFQPAETRIDVNASYMLSKHYSLFVSARDAFNATRKEIWRDDLGKYPSYAATSVYRQFGSVISFGVNGSW